jgi:hypothetical protein
VFGFASDTRGSSVRLHNRIHVTDIEVVFKPKLSIDCMVVPKITMYNTSMTAIVGIKHQSGITIKGDSLRIIPEDNSSNVVGRTEEKSKIYDVGNRAVLAFAGDALGENIEEIVTNLIRKTFKEHSKDSISDLRGHLKANALMFLKGTDATYGSSTQILIAGYDVSENSKLVNPSLWIVNSNKGDISIDSAGNYAPIGSATLLIRLSRSLKRRYPKRILKVSWSVKKLQMLLRLACSAHARIEKGDMWIRGKVAPLHVGGAIDHWKLSVS